MSEDKPQALLIDLDGTLISKGENLSSRAGDAVRAAAESIPVAIASGRFSEEVGHYARLLGLRGPQVAENGATLLEPLTGRHWTPANTTAPSRSGSGPFRMPGRFVTTPRLG